MAIYILITIAVLIGLKLVAQLFLEQLNRREVLAHSNSVPEPFRAMIEPEAYQKGVEYTLAKSRLTRFELVFDAVLLAVILFSGVLPWLYSGFVGQWGGGALVVSVYLVVVMLLISLPSLPVQWIEQFRLEERFGFNTTTPKLWWTDRLKGLILTFVIGYPLLLLIVKLVDWTGDSWWLWAWALVMAFQLVMLVLAPIVILPLFNKFTPLPEGSLRDRLLELGSRTGFHAKTILVMDGSKRSRHSNAFFTGFGRFRKIILFDTLIEHLDENELEAVLAHEIGHYKKRHIPKMLVASAIGLLTTFFAIAWVAEQPWFLGAFGFPPGSIIPALLLVSLLSGVLSFWLSPLLNRMSRKFEYEADAYAVEVVRTASWLVGALRKLNEKNLSNLTPHRLYSAFYYSHPTLLEREAALAKASTTAGVSRA